MPILLLLAAAAVAAVPHPETPKVFRDWIVGCDNGRDCQAVALLPENGGEGVTMVVRRAAGAAAPPEIAFALDADGAAGLAADGTRLNVRLVQGSDGAAVAPRDVAAVIAALRAATSLTLLDGKGAPLGAVSLAGASAALLFIDDRQQRTGTVTASARQGSKPASSVPPPPPLPLVHAAPAAHGPALTLGPARIAALRKAQGCAIDDVGGPDSLEAFALAGGRTLLLLACGSGAYNVSVVPLIARRSGNAIVAEPARFDAPQEWWENGKPMLVNADWDAKAELLSSMSKGRGVGDCGISQSYVWDGERFRLVHQAEMNVCRGSLDYITTWRAQVR